MLQGGGVVLPVFLFMRTSFGAELFPSNPLLMAHCDIYREHLGITYPLLGHALWEPTLVDVGDVGCIRNGKFLRLFNALHPRGHPSNRRFEVPDYHKPLVPKVPDHLDKGILKHGHYCSVGINATGEPETHSRG